MRSLLRWMASNSPLMLLALALAALAWVVAIEEADPTRTERYIQTIPVTPVGLPEGMMIVGEFEARVQVTVRVPESVRQSLEIDDFEATVDLTGLEAGTHRVPVSVKLTKRPSEITNYEPQSLSLELDYWTEQTVSVTIRTEGVPMLGYLTRTLSITPTLITVSGPSSYVAQVVEASARVSVQDANANVNEEFPLQLLNADGEPVMHSDITLSPASVYVYIPIDLSEEYGTLTVRPVRSGQVAFGYRIVDITTDPPTVNIRGAPDVIAGLPGYIDTEPIDVEGTQTDLVRHPALAVPPNVTLLPGQQLTVTIYVEAIQSSLTTEITPTLQGLEPGLVATVSPQTIEILLSGPLPQLEALGANAVRIIVDLFDLGPGMHSVAPQVLVPPEITSYSILPAIVQVEIFATPTLTPTLDITSTITSTVSPIPTPTND